MKLCKGCAPSAYCYTVQVDVNRTNFCQMVTGFAKAWWRGDKVCKMNMHTKEAPIFMSSDGKQLWPPFEKSKAYEPALNLACEKFESEPSSRFCGKCGYSRADHSAQRTKADP